MRPGDLRVVRKGERGRPRRSGLRAGPTALSGRRARSSHPTPGQLPWAAPTRVKPSSEVLDVWPATTSSAICGTSTSGRSSVVSRAPSTRRRRTRPRETTRVSDASGDLFAERRPATPAELARLRESFGVEPPPAGLLEAEIGHLESLNDLGSLPTVLSTIEGALTPGSMRSVAEVSHIFLHGGGDTRDQDAFRWAFERAADPGFEPELLVEPFADGWWLIDAVHRAAALYAKRREMSLEVRCLPVFVLDRPLGSG
jgi:hypothetical protein